MPTPPRRTRCGPCLDLDRAARAELLGRGRPDLAEWPRPRYALDLLDWAEARGWTPHHTSRSLCLTLVADPRHKHGNACHGTDGLLDLDHPVLLRRPDSSAWAVLSQPYPGSEDGRGDLLGPAPYGHGTVAELVEARHVLAAAPVWLLERWLEVAERRARRLGARPIGHGTWEWKGATERLLEAVWHAQRISAELGARETAAEAAGWT